VAEVAPGGRRGEAMGYYTMTWGLAFTVGPWLGTYGLDRLGGPRFWSVILLLGLLSAVLTSRLRGRPAGGGP
jgi:MFS family permease